MGNYGLEIASWRCLATKVSPRWGFGYVCVGRIIFRVSPALGTFGTIGTWGTIGTGVFALLTFYKGVAPLGLWIRVQWPCFLQRCRPAGALDTCALAELSSEFHPLLGPLGLGGQLGQVYLPC